MAVTRLDWDVIASGSDSRLKSLPWITGKVRGGDAWVVLNELGRRYNSDVEKIRKDWSWGYANRAVRGAAVYSEHAAGTAVDFNAPKHPLGARGTFSSAQYAAIRRILKDLDGVVRFGGDYSGRKDEMHFELQGGAKKLATVAAKINKGGLGNVSPTVSKPPAKKPAVSKPAGKPTNSKADNRAIQQALNRMGIKVGREDGDNGPLQKAGVKVFQKHHGLVADGYWGPTTQAVFDRNAKVQAALKSKGYTRQIVDGYLGAQSEANIRHYQKNHGLYVDGTAGPKTRNKLGV